MRGTSVVLVALMWLFSPSGSSGAGSGEHAVADQPVFRTGVEVVRLTVTVADRQGRFVRDLSIDDFEVFEDGVPQALSLFERGNVPIDLAILIDTSASMAHRMHTVRAAAHSFVQTLGARDRASVIAFSHIVRPVQDWTGDQDLLAAAVQNMGGHGGTSLYTAIYVALRSFEPPPPGEVRRQAMIILSDGDDTSSLISFDDVFDAAKRSGVSIYGITVKSSTETARRRDSRPTGEFVMRMLSRETGARAFTISSFDELSGVYEGIAEEIANQYVLGYVPKLTTRERLYRHVQVRIGTRSDVTWRTRNGYSVQPEQAARITSP
jgi:Ca-activated chloride channel homolog